MKKWQITSCLLLLQLFGCVRARIGACRSRTDWACKNLQCINASKHCDGSVDCSDGSDELAADCSTYLCDVNKYRCAYGACVHDRAECDGKQDCLDNSDESSCQAGLSNATPEGSCRISKLPDNGYVSYPSDPDNRLYVGHIIEPGGEIAFRCKDNFLLVNESGEILGKIASDYCLFGKWQRSVPNCQPFCSTKVLAGVSYEATGCRYGKRTVQCTDPPRPGTSARIGCTNRYRNLNGDSQQLITCLDDGRWSSLPTPCSQVCGEEGPRGTPYIVNGEVADVKQVPWHVGVYQFKPKYNNYDLICGGTIVNARLVITAMHCFWNEAFRQPNDVSMFRVAAGKFYSDFTAIEPFKQEFFNVTKILYDANQYKGLANDYLADIALLVVEPYIRFQANIAPICIPTGLRNERKRVPIGWNGLLAGYGLTTPNGMISPVLKFVELPTVDLRECEKQTNLDLSDDKFCAGYLNINVSACEGDSGGGLVFAQDQGGRKIHYLRGIVSTGVKKDGSCDANNFASFTNVLYYNEFIVDNEVQYGPDLNRSF